MKQDLRFTASNLEETNGKQPEFELQHYLVSFQKRYLLIIRLFTEARGGYLPRFGSRNSQVGDDHARCLILPRAKNRLWLVRCFYELSGGENKPEAWPMISQTS